MPTQRKDRVVLGHIAKGETKEEFRERRNKEMRSYMRMKRNSPHLDKIEDEAVKRGMAPIDLQRLIMQRVAEGDLFKAILDD